MLSLARRLGGIRASQCIPPSPECERERTNSAPMSASECLARVRSQLEAAAARYHRPVPRLVAVSKTKPVEAVLDVYAAGQR